MSRSLKRVGSSLKRVDHLLARGILNSRSLKRVASDMQYKENRMEEREREFITLSEEREREHEEEVEDL